MDKSTEAVTTVPAPSSIGVAGKILAFRHNKEIKRFSKFFVVGIIGAVIDSGTFNLLNGLGWLNPIKLSFPFGFVLTGLGISGTIGFILAVTSNFFWNRFWVYPDSRSKPVTYQVATFFLVNIVGILIRIPILELLSIPFENVEHVIVPQLGTVALARLGENTAWALAVIVVMFWNFFVNRYWTYNDVD